MIPGIRKPNKMICRAIAWPTALSKHRQETRQKPWILSVVVHFGWSISERASFHSSGTRFSNYPDLRFPFRRNDVVFTPEKSNIIILLVYTGGSIPSRHGDFCIITAGLILVFSYVLRYIVVNSIDICQKKELYLC